MLLDTATRTLTLEPKDCTACHNTSAGPGREYARMVCPACQGTGSGPRGKRAACRHCFGRGSVANFAKTEHCHVCLGYFEDYMFENFCDRVPAETLDCFNIKFVYANRAQSFIEAYIGIGLYSCTDYGDLYSGATSEDKVINDIVKEFASGVQATKLVHPYERSDYYAILLNTLVVSVIPNGYSVVAKDVS